jgi:hypothetical protein
LAAELSELVNKESIMITPKMMIGDYVLINPNYCETEEEKSVVYKVCETYSDGMTLIEPLLDDPDSILTIQTYIHRDKLRVVYEFEV